IPWAVMVAVMLVFGRMSADSEITAMRACGVSILQIVSPILIITFLLTLFCLYLQVEVGPPLLGESRSLLKSAAVKQPMALFEPGAQIRYDNTVIYIEDKEGADGLKGVQIWVLGKDDELAQDISAAAGRLIVDEKNQILTIRLNDCLVSDKNRDTAENSSMPTRFFAQEMEFSFNYGKQLNAERLSERAKYMKLSDLMALIRRTKQSHLDTTDYEVELNQRIAFALSPIAFLLLGLPLAIRTSRRETSVGLFLSVILAGLFFLSIILCESLNSYPRLYPQYLLWIPNIAFQILGAVMTYRISQR
ncbi:MAG: LptF/LptG family permease, partial [Victivallaceae bacterium]|nr:LptF/LptG family permease [Victivallaceae bacterium]